MAKVNDFRDFDAFKASRSFVREIGQLVRTPSFAPNRNLVNQMERAAISVLSNFAEGYERDGNSEFIQFVSVSKGSVGELRGQLIYSLDIGLIPESRYEELDRMGISAARLLGGLNRYLSGSEKRSRKFDRRRKPNLQLVTRSVCGSHALVRCRSRRVSPYRPFYSSSTLGNFDNTLKPFSVTTPSSSCRTPPTFGR
jgi:four helix bundle protein